jgi:hypothetical protein
MTISMPPSDFSGRSGRCGTHIWPSLNSGLPESISALSASTVAVTPLVEASFRLPPADVEAGDRVEARRGALARIVGAADGDAAAGALVADRVGTVFFLSRP